MSSYCKCETLERNCIFVTKSSTLLYWCTNRSWFLLSFTNHLRYLRNELLEVLTWSQDLSKTCYAIIPSISITHNKNLRCFDISWGLWFCVLWFCPRQGIRRELIHSCNYYFLYMQQRHNIPITYLFHIYLLIIYPLLDENVYFIQCDANIIHIPVI